MAAPINTEKLRIYLLGKDVAELRASFFSILEKDDVLNNGMSQNKYDGLTRDELLLIALTQYKRYLEHGFPINLGWARWNVCVGQPKDVSRVVSCYVWQTRPAFTSSMATVETP